METPEVPHILSLIFNHVVFPPKLPGRADPEGATEEVQSGLLDRVLNAIKVLKRASGVEYRSLWESIEKSLKTCRSVNVAGYLDKEALVAEFKKLRSGNAIMVYLEQQNACILIRMPFDNDDAVIFEAFETSATAKEALAAKGALQWDFPGMAVSLDRSEFANTTFQDNLGRFIEQASVEPIDEFAAKTIKAGAEFTETRDTTDPAIITKFLMTLLETNGIRINTPVLRKHVKDDVCWDDAELPWRRSPFWLVLRVCIQRLLYLSVGELLGRPLYKFLMCSVLAQLLEDSVRESETADNLSAENCNFLKTKLCRRLAKLENERESSSPDIGKVYATLFATLAPFCETSIDFAVRTFESQWISFRNNFHRRIQKLPQRAEDQDLHLTLPNSALYFKKVVELHKSRQLLDHNVVEDEVSTSDLNESRPKGFADFSTHYSLLAETELKIKDQAFQLLTERSDCEIKCIDIANEIEKYLQDVGSSYDDDPEQMSIFILTLAELWMRMDKCAVTAYPLLKKYHPWWEPRWLDMLLLSKLRHIKRIREIQTYLEKRCSGPERGKMTIFTKPTSGCLSDCYLECDPENYLDALQQYIEGACSYARREKTIELNKLVEEFRVSTQGMETSSCRCRKWSDGEVDIRDCHYHYCDRNLNRLKKQLITIHEDFLPPESRLFEKRAIIFELGAPDALIAYRNVAWRIVARLCLKADSQGVKPHALHEYSQLSQFNRHRDKRFEGYQGLTLASRTKSCLGTHYQLKAIPVPSDEVLYPLGLTFEYYDAKQHIWLKDIPRKPNFTHRFAIRLPNLFSKFYRSSDFTAGGHGPSSYEAIARSTERPPGVSIHEGIAHRNLMGGMNRRWLSILVELGSSNINFSRLETTILFRFLALQIGPRYSRDGSPATNTLKDPCFCNRLMEQIEKRTEIISGNWRESKYMETLLIMVAQVRELACPESSAEAHKLLLNIRRVTYTWMRLLRGQMRDAATTDTAEDAARFCFLSALLCRGTFAPEVYETQDLDREGFQHFIEAMLTMQDSLVVTINHLSVETRNLLIGDIKMTATLRSMLKSMVSTQPSILQAAIDNFWPEGDTTSRKYSEWKFIDENDWWVISTVEATTAKQARPQIICYHLLEGHLRIDRHAIGRLPGNIRDSEIVKELFGNQPLVAFPSNMPGMSYMLAIEKEGYRIHLGYRDADLIIQAHKQNRVLEFIPRRNFCGGHDIDLPRYLLDECFHWLDIQSETIEIRRHHPWISTGNNWTLNISTRKATSSRVYLVDPHSDLFKSVAKIFYDFEDSQMLTVLQPLEGSLRVELKRMNLTFHVNKKKLLQCKQLSAEIDPNQDAGTLYGLTSMLVIRNVANRRQRSIITIMGAVWYRCHGIHMHVRMTNTGTYAKYDIDDVLGRLYCPSEPALLYNKALLHAFTSFFIPDPLTGRTGTEEALSCLQSGHCQPWTSLSRESLTILTTLSDLSPKRGYYPADKGVQQTVRWNKWLRTGIQHDAYRQVVDSIITKSKRLSLFDSHKPGLEGASFSNANHLQQRAIWRRAIYERSGVLSPEPTQPEDFPYMARDRWSTNDRTSNLREIVTLIRKQPVQLMTTDISRILQEYPLIGGYTERFTPCTLDESLSVDIPANWGSLVSTCRDWDRNDIYRHMFQLGLIAFSRNTHIVLLKVILCFFLFDDLRNLVYPPYSCFNHFKEGEKPTFKAILDTVTLYHREYSELHASESEEPRTLEEIRQIDLKKKQHGEKCMLECKRFSTFLLKQWPREELSVDGFESRYLDVRQALHAIVPEWSRLYENLQLSKHIKEIQVVLNKHCNPTPAADSPPTLDDPELFGMASRHKYYATQLAGSLVQKNGPRICEPYDMENVRKWIKENAVRSTCSVTLRSKAETAEEVRELEEIIDSMTSSGCPVKSRYGQDLKESINALKAIETVPEDEPSFQIAFLKGTVYLNNEIEKARSVVSNHYHAITEALSRNDSRFHWLSQSNLWPCVTPVTLLEQLRSTPQLQFGLNMRESLISYGLEIVKLQQLIRIKGALRKNDRTLHQEYKNRGHINWHPSTYPDWLLLEIDSNFQIREEQATVALEIISPTSGSNSVLQMNMGQGKTSVIMPMVASVLADGEKLARLLVPKALLSQTAEILQTRLGGLIGRQITHIPFSRKTETTESVIDIYRKLHDETIKSSGIILGIPEHVLSFKLSGIQKISDSRINEAFQMVKTQNWMNNVCRDVLDECDFTLAVRTQLIYPSGTQLMVDGHPDRWEVAMVVLNLVAHHARLLARDFPQSIDIVERSLTGFPLAYFLRKDAEVLLVQKIVDDICSGQILPMHHFSSEESDAIKAFISCEDVDSPIEECISHILPDKPPVRKKIYLLRGLLARGILILCLKRRWNVQYGLHPRRDPIAVPFHAKGVPSDRAEWGHPDVAILLTCLSFYYQGLSQDQLRQSLEIILESDDPASEYDSWIQASTSLPEALRHWNMINIDDRWQIQNIWRHLRFSVIVINHFLGNVVFPLHAKQFRTKLQMSGWDIPLYNDSQTSPSSDDTGDIPGVTTGFSGTNDNRRLLPLTIQQRDLPSLLHTNAEVLTYLLQKRNRQCILAADSNNRRISELDLLHRLKERNIRILIDSGAFILEMDNRTLAQKWLQEDETAQAAVYFGPDNKAWVQYRIGKTVPLVSSPLADNLENCLVYLDEAHTRGTDLKLPPAARGALTLGLNQTKDHTVQAAMRLRQLGTTQSITFIAPPEVHQSILDIRQKGRTGYINSYDVIVWLLTQTCDNIRDLQPLYYAQGSDFCRRMQAARRYKDFLGNTAHRNAYIENLRQSEQQALEKMYAPRSLPASLRADAFPITERKLVEFMQELNKTYGKSYADSSFATSALEEVEQEREVANEVEEREVQRPRPMTPLEYPGLDKSILDFVKTGQLKTGGHYMKASRILSSTQLALKHGIDVSSFMPHLYVSLEFTRTVKLDLGAGETHDNYIRPVNWILYSRRTEDAIVIIPEEVEQLIQIFWRDPDLPVHLILYAAPVTKRMQHFNRLAYYSIPSLPVEWTPPPWLPVEIGILAGRLYFDFSEYTSLLDRFQSQRTKIGTLLEFIQEWSVLRRSGQNISHTPMGFLCQGLPLDEGHPFFSTRKTQEQAEDIQCDPFPSTLNHAESAGEHYYDGEDMDPGVGMSDDESGDEGIVD
ncbi:hypothetical protein DTO207G8_3210 [Paecilomyces variotii]|nr:hypothetical protein DTO207G8_3210 [Paecilomyces variotii]